LAEQKDWDAEHRRCKERIASQPEWFLPYAEDAELYLREGHFSEAANRYAEAIARATGDSSLRSILFGNLGLALRLAGRLDDAIVAFERAAALAPDSAEAHRNLGHAYFGRGVFAKAVRSYVRCLRLKPGDANVHNSLGNALLELGKRSQAIEQYRLAVSAINENPSDDPGLLQGVLRNLGNALLEARRFSEAEPYLVQAIEMQPNSADAQNSYGSLLLRQDRLADAEIAFQRALALKPNSVEARSNLGTIEVRRNRPDLAAKLYESALALEPASADTRFNLALCLLMQGEYRRGWHEYEWRWGVKDLDLPRRRFSQPQWNGEPLAGERILLHAEQGFGDTIQFSRFATLVAARGGEVILQVPRALREMMRGVAGVSHVVAQEEPLPEFVWQCPLMSLPHALAVTLEDIPVPTGYLTPDPSLQVKARTEWMEHIAGPTSRRVLRVGLTWSGNPKNINDRRRSIPLSVLMRGLREGLGTESEVAFFSLQVGTAASQMTELDIGSAVHDACAHCDDFADTAAVISLLDLVITVDTAVAHLAGASGKPVWILLAYAPDWRWMLDREDSAWYASARLFRQSGPGDWDGVAKRAGNALRTLAEEHMAERVSNAHSIEAGVDFVERP
jgi:tetratricopeptide (TPR) repeat protein